MTFILLSIILLLFVFPNSMFIVFSLLILSITSLLFLTANLILAPITSLILVIVYVGAIMILIGYICAVTPNPSLEPSYTYVLPLLAILLSSLFLFPSSPLPYNVSSSPISLDSFFYSSYGLHLLALIILMLLLILLISTSQHTVTKGPFRSTS